MWRRVAAYGVAVEIRCAETVAEIEGCFDVMAELRPHLERDGFVGRVRAMQKSDRYRIAFLLDTDDGGDGRVVAVAGYRLSHHLAWGKTLYIDDLVTTAGGRSRGWGAAMISWLKAEASREGCDQLHLDSGVWRKDAHRFYEREGLERSAYHFSIELRE